MAASSDIDARIAACANAYRRALQVGDAKLVNPEKAILLALVARSAAETQSWIHTRIEDGDRRAAPLEGLARSLSDHDIVGRTLQRAQAELIRRARQVVMSTAGVAATPVWMAAAVALVLGIGGLLINVGSAIGGVLAFLVFLFCAAAAVSPFFRTWTLGLLGKTPQAMSTLGGAAANATGGVVGLFTYAGSVGSEAHRVFLENVSNESDTLRGANSTRHASSVVLTPLRSLAKAIVAASVVALVACIITLGFGINHGFLQRVRTCEQQYGSESNCGLTK